MSKYWLYVPLIAAAVWLGPARLVRWAIARPNPPPQVTVQPAAPAEPPCHGERVVERSQVLAPGATCELENVSGHIIVRRVEGRTARLRAVTEGHARVEVSASEQGVRARALHERRPPRRRGRGGLHPGAARRGGPAPAHGLGRGQRLRVGGPGRGPQRQRRDRPLPRTRRGLGRGGLRRRHAGGGRRAPARAHRQRRRAGGAADAPRRRRDPHGERRESSSWRRGRAASGSSPAPSAARCRAPSAPSGAVRLALSTTSGDIQVRAR